MEIKQVKALVEILKKNELTALEYTDKDLSIKIAKEPPSVVSVPTSIPVQSAALSEQEPVEEDFAIGGLQEITAPLAGVFYASSSPETAPFVKVGDRIKKGTVVCIIEAMKLMNEITSDKDGEIADICVNNEQVVEYGQTLFRLI